MKTLLSVFAITGCVAPDVTQDLADARESEVVEEIAVGSSFPADGQTDVDRTIGSIVMTYTEGQLDCSSPITGVDAFHIYSTDPALTAARQQDIYPGMPVGFGMSPSLRCDESNNRLILALPGPLLGGSPFQVDTRARAKDGTTISKSITFRTKNPGLKTYITKVTNEIYECDTHYPLSTSYRCDVYVLGMIKTRTASASQINSKFPTTGDWTNWAEDTSKPFGTAPLVLSSDAVAVGDVVGIELHAYDYDASGGATKALTSIGGLGKVSSSFVPPSGTVTEGMIQNSTSLPVGEDDFEGGGTYFVSKAKRWGTVTRNHRLKLPGRPTGSQIVVDFVVEEFPTSWFAPPIVL